MLYAGAVVEKRVNAPRSFVTDTINLHQIGDCGAFDRFERAKVVQQRTLAGRSDAGDLLQS